MFFETDEARTTDKTVDLFLKMKKASRWLDLERTV
jgi:hypothetical protein